MSEKKEETLAEKRPLTDSVQEQPETKKQKKTDTIPILRGKFKQRWLVKHSSLIKRSDDVSGIMVSCNVNAETRALGQVSNCLEKYIDLLFPNNESTWSRFEGDFDVQVDEDDKPLKEKDPSRKDKKFQAVDAACGGLVFYRFRINVKPTDFVMKLMDYIKALPKDERDVELRKINHSARWIPLDYICPAVTERIKTCFEQRVKPDYFADNNELSDDTTVAIMTEIRNNIMITKEEIIQTIAPMIPSKYKVDLKKPTLVIFVTVFKSACGISVLKEYYDRKKYNLAVYSK